MEQGDFRQGTAETQAQDVGISVTVCPLVLPGTGVCGAVICRFVLLFLHQMVSGEQVYRR